MTATAQVNANVKFVGEESAVQVAEQFPLAASAQVGRAQFATASPSTGYASLNDGATPNQIAVGMGYPSFLSDTGSAAGGSPTLHMWQGEVHGVVPSTVSNDGFDATDIGTPFWIADENTPGKLSNSSGDNRSLGGLVFGLFGGLPNLWSGVVAWLLARATLITNSKAHAWYSIADGSAGATVSETAIQREKLHGVITAVHFIGAAVAADNSDYVTITIAKRDGAGGGATTVATYDSRAANQGAITAFVPAAFSLSAVAGALNLLETDVVTVTVAKGGSGKVLTGAIRVLGKVI